MFISVDCEPEATDCLARLADTRRTVSDGSRWTLGSMFKAAQAVRWYAWSPPPAGSLIDIEFFSHGGDESAPLDGGTAAPAMDGSAIGWLGDLALSPLGRPIWMNRVV